jgi:hypothetical protein
VVSARGPALRGDAGSRERGPHAAVKDRFMIFISVDVRPDRFMIFIVDAGI